MHTLARLRPWLKSSHLTSNRLVRGLHLRDKPNPSASSETRGPRTVYQSLSRATFSAAATAGLRYRKPLFFSEADRLSSSRRRRRQHISAQSPAPLSKPNTHTNTPSITPAPQPHFQICAAQQEPQTAQVLMLAMRIGGGSDFFFSSSRSDVDVTKIAMLGASSPLASSSSSSLAQQQQAQSMPPSLKPLEPTAMAATMLDRELLQHYAYLRYGDAGSKDKAANGGRKQHVCPVKTCGRRFSTPGNLSRHKRLHGPIKPLKCPVEGCICAFRSENKLEKHMKFHLGIPVHVCPVPACGKTFSTAGNLNRHIKGHHPHVDPFDLKHSTYSTSSSCDEYESSVGGDELMRERHEEEEQEQHEEQIKQELLSGALASSASLNASAVETHTYQPTTVLAAAQPPAQAPADQLDALVAILDQDIGDDDVSMDLSSSPAMDAELESESMLSLLLEQPKRKYSLLDDMIRFHINHCSTAEEGEDEEQHTDSATCVL